ncbi:DUF892 family protein [Mucilaginibacter litoreus]|uniref:DUF892 family protein n=1 Tax=Mucilaginibacter litoreus TaxID=1048221 RepID=A0ABW3AU29_9SPHI
MKDSASRMRLFNGHQKMNEQSLKKVFLTNLSNIYSIKSYLIDNLPLMAESATFIDLKNAILESVDEIRIQLLRIESIFKILNETYHPGRCLGIKAFIIEAYRAATEPGVTNFEADFTILYHLRALEALESACYDSLYDMARSMPNPDMSTLLKHNLDMANDSGNLYKLITKEYLN